MNPLYLLFLFTFMLSACHCNKEACTQTAYVQEVARSDISISDVDTYLNKLVNRDIVISLQDVVVEYPGDDTSKVADNKTPYIRSPVGPSKLSVGKITISDKTEESTNLHVEDNSIQATDYNAEEAAVLEQQVKQESVQFQPSQGSVFMIFLFILLVVVMLVILYRKGKLRL